MPSDFVHLHLHSEYSLLDGMIKIKDLVKTAKSLGMDSVAVTDHGNMFGAATFHYEAKKIGVKSIIGCETYLSDDRHIRSASDNEGEKIRNYHLVLLAQNPIGYKNLVNIVTKAQETPYRGKPRADFNLISEHSAGLIALTACKHGQIPTLLLQGKEHEAYILAKKYEELLGKGNYFIEIQNIGEITYLNDKDFNGKSITQREINKILVSFAKKYDLPLVATADCHYLKKEDKKAQDILLCIQHKTTVNNPNRLKFNSENYFRTQDEMLSYFQEIPEAVYQTKAIAEKIEEKLWDDSFKLPKFGFDEEDKGKPSVDVLKEKVLYGLTQRFNGQEVSQEWFDRIDFELKTIDKMGFSDYMLIVQDFINHAKSSGIPVGPGRGSAAGSAIAFCLGITNIDPIKNNLLFERFLNPDRISMPDIDVDFCKDKRSEVVEYVKEKYGADRVANIITFGRMNARGAIRDVGRVMNIPLPDVDRIAKLIPLEAKITIEKALEVEPKLKFEYDNDPTIRELLDSAKHIEGLSKNVSMHAAGILITPDAVTNFVPLAKVKDETGSNGEPVYTTQYEMTALEKMGLLKFDFLGLKTLTILNETIRFIRENHGIEIDINSIDLSDEKTYDLLKKANSNSVFQLESYGMKDLLKKMQPSEFTDLSALVALFRPGPLGSGMVDSFVRRKHGEEAITYPWGTMKEELHGILKDTYGVIAFQEQVMQIAHKIGGFSLAQADTVRKAMGKKDMELLNKQKNDFVSGAISKGHPKADAEELWNLMVKFGEYGFNKCLIGSSKIQLADGTVESIENLFYNKVSFVNKQKVWALSEKDLKINAQKIEDIIENGVKTTFKVTTKSGKEIICTDNHPFYLIGGWKELKNLSVGDMIATPRQVHALNSQEMNKHELIVAAHLLSEGNVCHPNTVQVYNDNMDFLKDFQRHASRFPNVVCNITKYKRHSLATANAGGNKQHNSIREWAIKHEIFGKNSYSKKVPKFVFKASNEDVALFLGRIWSGDGFIATEKRPTLPPYYATSSKTLAYDISTLLLRVGLISKVEEKKFKYKYNGKTSIKTGYVTRILGMHSRKTFSDRIAVHCIGRDKVVSFLKKIVNSQKEKYIGKETVDIVPKEVKNIIKRLKDNTQKSWNEIESEAKVSMRCFYGDKSLKGKRGFRRSTIAKLAEYFNSEQLASLAYSDIFWDEITKIEYHGKEMTYDLTIAKDHNFVADNIFVHNSHSAAYAYIAYQTAYLKAHYPLEFMAANLTAEVKDEDKLLPLIDECRINGIEIKPPDINKSKEFFSIEGNSIRPSFSSVSKLGDVTLLGIIEERKKNPTPYKSFEDFYKRLKRSDVRITSANIVALNEAGAFDSLYPTISDKGRIRALIEAKIEGLKDWEKEIKKEEKRKNAPPKPPKPSKKKKVDEIIDGQGALFGFEAEDSSNNEHTEQIKLDALDPVDVPPLEVPTPSIEEQGINIDGESIVPWSKEKVLDREKESLGFYLSGHPVADVRKPLEIHGIWKISDVRSQYTVSEEQAEEIQEKIKNYQFEPIKILGVFQHIDKKKTKKDLTKYWARVKFEDETGTIDINVFPKVLEGNDDIFKTKNIAIIECKPDFGAGTLRLNAESVLPIEKIDKYEQKIAEINTDNFKIVPTGVQSFNVFLDCSDPEKGHKALKEINKIFSKSSKGHGKHVPKVSVRFFMNKVKFGLENGEEQFANSEMFSENLYLIKKLDDITGDVSYIVDEDEVETISEEESSTDEGYYSPLI